MSFGAAVEMKKSAVSQSAILHKVLLKDPAALCLDGSPGAYYVLKGKVP